MFWIIPAFILQSCCSILEMLYQNSVELGGKKITQGQWEVSSQQNAKDRVSKGLPWCRLEGGSSSVGDFKTIIKPSTNEPALYCHCALGIPHNVNHDILFFPQNLFWWEFWTIAAVTQASAIGTWASSEHVVSTDRLINTVSVQRTPSNTVTSDTHGLSFHRCIVRDVYQGPGSFELASGTAGVLSPMERHIPVPAWRQQQWPHSEGKDEETRWSSFSVTWNLCLCLKSQTVT